MTLKMTIGPPTHHIPIPIGFVEFPKWVHFEDKGKPSVLVSNAEEEKAVLAGSPLQAPAEPVRPIVSSPAPIQTLQGMVDERASLLTIAEARSIKIDKRWKTDKIRRAVEAATETTE